MTNTITIEEKPVKTYSEIKIRSKKLLPKCNVCKVELHDKRSETCKKHVDKSYCRNKPSPNKGMHWKLNLSEEQKKRRTEVGRARVMSPESRAKMRKWHIEHPFRFKKDTGIELKVEKELQNLGVFYEKQTPLLGISCVDFYLPEYRIVIQCDGCYWHSCPTHYPKHNITKPEKDAKKDAILAFHGFKVYRFWEHEINSSVEDCIQRIKFI